MNRLLEWSLLVILALAGACLWCRLALPRYQSIDLSVSQSEAFGIAKNFLTASRGVDVRAYKTAVSFSVDDATDRYLQRTLGISGSQQWVRRWDYDLFCWVFRFFKEKQKEEYKVAVSPATGRVIGFSHVIDDSASRPSIDKDKARQMAFDFLISTFGFKPSQYIFHGEEARKLDNRVDYTFAWANKDVDIPWGKGSQEGHGKLLTSITVSGGDILSFAKYQFDVPDSFNRYVDNLKQTGQNLTLVFRLFYLALITLAIVVVVNHKQHVVSRNMKPFYISVGTVMFVLMALDILNSYQDLLFDYPTTQSLGDYCVRQFIEGIISPFFIAVGFVLPAMAGESLRFEVSPQKKNRGFLGALMTSFFSRNIGRQILVGYLGAAVMLGMQSVIFQWGFKYCGVWEELSWLTQTSTAVVPAFTALMVGFQASFSEESMFRLFAINFFRKYGVLTLLAVFLAAMMWGFGHTGYEIFPMWFRGVEVTSIGLIMGFFYLRYGLMCVIAAHFFIDAFYTGLPYLLKPRPSFDFYSALLVVFLPLVWALIARVLDRGRQERSLSLRFNAQQQFNYNLLLQLCATKNPEELAILKKDLQRHGWDAAIIQRVFEEKEVV